jgi:hypothetical protein
MIFLYFYGGPGPVVQCYGAHGFLGVFGFGLVTPHNQADNRSYKLLPVVHEEKSIMPIISMFYGIIIRLYLIDNQHHNLPHIHAKYAEFEASIGLDDGEILAGNLPRKQLRLVQAWIELHRDELMADWELAASGESPYKIEPL